MSEINENTPATPESIADLGIPEISISLSASDVIQQPTDATLTAQGMPADAKAVGDRFSEVDTSIIELAADVGAIEGKANNAVLFTEQSLETEEQAQARENIGLGDASTYSVASDFSVSTAGTAVLDAALGSELDGRVDDIESGLGTAAGYGVANNLTTSAAGENVLDAAQGKVLSDRIALAVSTEQQDLTDNQKDRARTNIGAVGSGDLTTELSDVVRTSVQSIGTDAQTQARTNIGAIGSSDLATALSDVVRTSVQSIGTDAQAQARSNIGAIAASDLETALSGMIIMQTSDLFEDYDLASGSYLDSDYTCPTVTGYTPLGIVGYGVYGGSSTNALVYRLRYNPDNGVIRVGIRNMGTSTASLRLSVSVLYIKSAS